MLTGKFRPWGETIWVLQHLENKKWNFVGSVSTEDRCIAAFEILQNGSFIEKSSFFEIIDPITKKEHVDKLENNRNRLLAIDDTIADRINKQELLLQDILLHAEIEKLLDNSIPSLIIDISCLPKRYFFPLVKLAINDDRIENLVIIYTKPEKYCSGDLSEEPEPWYPLPNMCPYCQTNPHDNRICSEVKATKLGPDWNTLRAKGSKVNKPKTLAGWQKMFDSIYQPTSSKDFQAIYARLVEELGELAEAIRVYSAEPGYFLSEACDVFAWLMRLQNEKEKKLPPSQLGYLINYSMAKNYPDICSDCQQSVCSCPPILKSTIGRIAHEVPISKDSLIRNERFLTADQLSEKFGNI